MDTGEIPTLSNLLRQYRVGAGLTQEELAARAGLTPGAISLLERGERIRPWTNTVERLIRALRLSAQNAEKFREVARGWSLNAADYPSSSSQDTVLPAPHDAVPSTSQAEPTRIMNSRVANTSNPQAQHVLMKFDKVYESMIRKASTTSMSVLIWRPSLENSGPVSKKRDDIQQELKARKFSVRDASDFLQEGAHLHEFQAYAAARAADQTIVVMEEDSEAIRQGILLCSRFEILSKMVAFIPERSRSAVSAMAWILEKGYDSVHWYQDDEITSCNLKTRSVERCEARRLVGVFIKGRST